MRKTISGLSEQQLSNIVATAVSGVLSEMAYPASFNFEEFNRITTFNGRKAYCEQRLQRIASGSSRIVYKIDEDKCLKLAKNSKGIAQNEEEIYNSFIREYLGAKIYDYGEHYEWMEMQLARKATAADFKRLTGFPFKVMQRYIAHCYNQYGRGTLYIEPQYAKMFDEWWQGETSWFDESVFDEMYDYLMNSCIEMVGDFQRLSSWGVVTDEDGQDRLVIIDYGLSEEVYNKFYSPRRRFNIGY